MITTDPARGYGHELNIKDLMGLLDHMREAGFDVKLDVMAGGFLADRYELSTSVGTVRVDLRANGGYSADVYRLDAHGVVCWMAQVSSGTPAEVLIALVEAAEATIGHPARAELALRRELDSRFDTTGEV